MQHAYDLILRNGRLIDGTGAPSAIRHIGIRDGLITEISEQELPEHAARRVIDASGQWVVPGFLDIHTHYDAELLSGPGLPESVRHGVTTVLTGSCSLSTVYSDALNCADLFARVEALPYEPVLDLLTKQKTWTCPEGWIDRLNQSALGPNVASFLGHSDVRTQVMGLDRATTRGVKPTVQEREDMVQMLEEALASGFVGLSTMTNPWDKLAGDRYRSRALPSTYATWREYNWFHRVLRRTDRVLQSAPNLNTKVNIIRFFTASGAFLWRKAMKTSLISAADPKASPWIAALFGRVTRFSNWLMGAKMNWQAVPCPFEIYADGIDLVVFEEFGAGAEAIHLADELERSELLQDKAYRRRFRRDYEKKFSPRIWHRDFHDARIVACPDRSVVGKTIGQVADEQDIHVCDAFLDLVVTHGKGFRWKTVIANHRPRVLETMLSQPDVQVGFSDSGAHLRNMAFYNAPLRLLKMVQDAIREGRPFLSLEKAVHKMTGQLADWFDLDTGKLTLGARADLVVINPEGLDDTLSEYHEAAMPEMGGLRRMVRRNDQAVRATLIGGRVAFESGQFSEDFGTQRYGRFLRAGKSDRSPVPEQNQNPVPEQNQNPAPDQSQNPLPIAASA